MFRRVKSYVEVVIGKIKYLLNSVLASKYGKVKLALGTLVVFLLCLAIPLVSIQNSNTVDIKEKSTVEKSSKKDKDKDTVSKVDSDKGEVAKVDESKEEEVNETTTTEVAQNTVNTSSVEQVSQGRLVYPSYSSEPVAPTWG